MAFDIKNKVALVSGGASGIGLVYAKELLKNGLRGVTLADINEELGQKALQVIESVFGPKRAIFVQTDVTKKDSFEGAFKKTVDFFQNLDILINNAGILNDAVWEKEVAVNINGTINGTLLGLDTYIPKYKSGPGGVIVNISSIGGLHGAPTFPLYSATKFAILGLSKAFGSQEHYDRTKVKVLSLCPGGTDTPMMGEASGRTLGPEYQKLLDHVLKVVVLQKPENVAKALVYIIRNCKSGTVWVVEDDKEPYEYIHPPREDFAPK